ncbi:hypothetical protein GCM10023093_09710 [Nemorincola caseinilytica]|uniref:Uncharacterized protein n=1 Tax=Nemorincola caseinilytica TaxID=2054315 RepID=A0ABP8NAI1_9BACT
MGGKAAKRWSESEDLPLHPIYGDELIAAFGTKSTGEKKAGHTLHLSYLDLPQAA